MIKRLTALLLIILAMSCRTTQGRISDQYLQDLCGRVKEIKTLPFKGEHVKDEVYNGMLEAGDSIVPCLIEKMSDTTVMPDPRQAPVYDAVTVGDVAFWVIYDITGMSEKEYESFFPSKVQAKFNSQGVYAYFEYVENSANRRQLQEKVLEWFNGKG